jgi:hypothetical protein
MGKFKVGDKVKGKRICLVSKCNRSYNLFDDNYHRVIVEIDGDFVRLNGDSFLWFSKVDFEVILKTLPKSFACKNTNDKLWKKYIKWLNKEYGRNLTGDSYNWPYYGIMSSGEFDHNKSSYFDTILSLEEWDEIVNGVQIKETEEVMKTNEITKDQLKQIHDVACSGWKAKIIEFAARNPFGNTVEFTSEEIAEMFKASDNKQTKVLESIFGSQQQELDFRSNDINFKQDGIKVFGNSDDSLTDAFIGLPTMSTSMTNDKFFLNPDYVWKLNGDMLICTRK